MPRGPRIDAPGCVQHVMLRGVERRLIFHDDHDCEELLSRLSHILPEALMRCLAWALMPNHVHMVLQTGPVPLARVMARIGTGYAQAFNRRHDRVGHLFQNRYKSILVRDEAQLRVLVRYVHRNPLEARLVTSLDALASHAWTGHASLMGRASAPFQDTEAVLQLYGQSVPDARRRLVAWMGQESDWDSKRTAIAAGERVGSPSRRQSRARSVARIDELIASVCAAHGVPEAELRCARTRAVSNARAEIAHRACAELGLTGAAVARALLLSPGAVTIARARGRRLLSAKRDRPAGNN